MALPVSIASICRGLPSPADPSEGIFVLRRLEAMARQVHVTTLQPLPYFPIVAPLPGWAKAPQHDAGGLNIEHAPMFYLPRFLKSIDGFWLYRSIYSRLAALKASKRLDIVDAHFAYPEGVGALWAAKKLGIPVFVTLRGFEAEYIHRPFIGQQIRHLLRYADGCICVAHFLQKLAIEHGAASARTRVIHNAIDRQRFFPGNQIEARRSLELSDDAPIVVSVGHLTSRKRHHVLIEAFAAIVASYPSARLLIIGASTFEPNYRRELKEQTQRLGIASAVDLVGNICVERVADYLRAADVFALATQREGCCNAVLEALACGLPVVTTPVGDNTWFVKEGKNGYLVPVDDSRKMSVALTTALERSDWDRDRISATLEVGDWDGVASRALEFFAERTQAGRDASATEAGLA